MYLKTVLIDLDGVLNNYKKYEENYIPEIKEGALEFLEKVKMFIQKFITDICFILLLQVLTG